MVVHAVPARSAVDTRWLALPVATLATALGVAAVVSPVAAVIGVAGVVFVAVAFHDLAVGVALFTAFTFLAQVPGVSGSLPVKVAGLVLVLAALRRSGTPLLLKEHPAVAYTAVFFAVWAVTSPLWAENPPAAAGDALRLVLDVALLFIVFAAVRDMRRARWVIWGFLGGAAVAAVVGLVVPGYDLEGRVGGTLGNPNLLAAMLVPALVFSLFALEWTRSAALRLLLVAGSLVLTVTLFLTQSRGGLFALAAALVAGLLFGGALRRRFVAMTVVAAAVGLVYYTAFASSESLERIASPGGGTGRTDIWSVSTKVIADHPLLGVGAGNFPLVAPQYASETGNLPDVQLVVDTPKVTHNAYLGVLADLGAIGLAAFLLVVLATLVLALRSTRAFARLGDAELELVSRAVLIGLVSLLASFVFLSGQYEKQFWLLLGFAVALYAMARRRERAGRARAPD